MRLLAILVIAVAACAGSGRNGSPGATAGSPPADVRVRPAEPTSTVARAAVPDTPLAAVAAPPSAAGPSATPAASLDIVGSGRLHGPWLEEPRVNVVRVTDDRGNAVPLAVSKKVDISLWPGQPVSCRERLGWFTRLAVARDNEPPEPLLQLPVQRWGYGPTFRFLTMDFDGVAADLASDPSRQFKFFMPGGSIWVHALDQRTHLTAALPPTGYADLVEGNDGVLNVRIQEVLPHDRFRDPAPVTEASQVDIAFDVFAPNTFASLRPDFIPEVRGGKQWATLWQATDSEPFKSSYKVPVQTRHAVDGKTYPRWVFEDVWVSPSAANHFVVTANLGYPTPNGRNGYSGTSNVWTHATEAQPRIPQGPPLPPYDKPLRADPLARLAADVTGCRWPSGNGAAP